MGLTATFSNSRSWKVIGTNLIDPKEYPPIEGMEGPWYFADNGRTLYYDPKEGRYYDRKTDLYIEDDQYLLPLQGGRR